MRSKRNRRLFFSGAATIAALLAFSQPIPAFAQEQTYAFDIPSQELGLALRAFAHAARQQVTFEDKVVQGKRNVPLRGNYTARDALDQLLSGSGLSVVTGQSGLFIVRDNSHASLPPGAVAGELKLAQSEMQKIQDEQAKKTEEDRAALKQADPKFEELVVTGTHIRGAQNLAAPSVIITREEIGRTGYSSIKALAESIPQNFSEVSPDGAFSDGGSNVAQANADRASAIDLRGLGAQSTLTLVNGTRRAGSIGGRVVDISAIPLSIIERVEVVTGGRSAVYGSDAVAGVVNFVTRKDYEGSQTEASYGGSRNGGEELQASQIFGTKSESGGFVVAYDYSRQWAFDLVDTGLLVSPTRSGLIRREFSIDPDQKRNSGYVAGHVTVIDGIEAFADAQYTNKKYDYLNRYSFSGLSTESFDQIEQSSDFANFGAGLKALLSRDWQINLQGTSSEVKGDRDTNGFLDLGFISADIHSVARSTARIRSGSLGADGPLFSIAKSSVRAAVGVEYREEEFSRSSQGATILNDGTNIPDPTIGENRSRTVRSAYAEFLIPILNSDRSWISRRLELSVAGRYDDYSDVGDTVNPQVGIVWSPMQGVNFRSTFSKAFRSPALSEFISNNFVEIQNTPDPSTGATSPVLQWTGGNNNLRPEKAKTWSFGVDYVPASAQWASVALSYFNVEYEGRLDTPASGPDELLALEREARYVGLINRAPTAAELASIVASDSDGFVLNGTGRPWNPATQSLLSAFPNLIVFDNRIKNVAVESFDGLDLSFNAETSTDAGTFRFGINTAITLHHDRSVTASSPEFRVFDEVGKASRFRARVEGGWQKGALSSYVHVNYIDSYDNPFLTPHSTISAWTTVDLNVGFDTSAVNPPHAFRNLALTLSVINLADRDPPAFREGLQGLGYDPSNANPLGRYVSLRLLKTW